MAPYEALYGRKCRTYVCWTELYDRKTLGPELIQETENIVRLIRDRLKQAFDRLKSYADRRLKDIEFAVGDLVFLKVSPWKKVLRFGWKGKLSPRFIGSYRILERVGMVAYRLELPPHLSRIHNVFHVSMLQQYRPDPSHVIQVQDVELRPDLSYVEEPVQILDQDEKVLRNRRIPMVKVQWSNRSPFEATWETEKSMREQFPHLFNPASPCPDGSNRTLASSVHRRLSLRRKSERELSVVSFSAVLVPIFAKVSLDLVFSGLFRSVAELRPPVTGPQPTGPACTPASGLWTLT
ncbi:hypothetical protein V6N12_047413 [Hibiscus sabdariffa]|uniref:Tf2-1-like SH3-like domain-containing protein n=1 Tax=Hibiscus sabdariffa TaxID=183260 RepID=A0ABR2DAU0_9ROSI